jgi:hypothetical protein
MGAAVKKYDYRVVRDTHALAEGFAPSASEPWPWWLDSVESLA